MQKLLFSLLLLPFFASAQNGDFTLEGKMKDLPFQPDWVYLQYRTESTWKTDSVQAKDGKYTFQGRVAEPGPGYLRVKYLQQEGKEKIVNRSSRDNYMVFLQPGKIKINSEDSLTNAEVKGSAAHAEYLKMNKGAKPYDSIRQALLVEYRKYGQAKDKENQSKVEKQIEDVDLQKRENVYGVYVKNNPSSPIALYTLQQYAGWAIDADKVEPLYLSLSDANKNYPSAKTLVASIDIAKKTGVGKMAMDFTQNDTLDNPISLSSFKGRYVLVDFWASWCGPCREENPNVVKAYQKFKDKNFHIIGVSLDRPGQKDRWMKAIHDDGLTWTQVSDLKFWDNSVAKQYGIQAIPQNLLIGPDGKIVAKNLSGADLEKKMEELLSN